jgi:hypothetical protein
MRRHGGDVKQVVGCLEQDLDTISIFSWVDILNQPEIHSLLTIFVQFSNGLFSYGAGRHAENGSQVVWTKSYKYDLFVTRITVRVSQQNAVASLSGHRVTNELYYIHSFSFPMSTVYTYGM